MSSKFFSNNKLFSFLFQKIHVYSMNRFLSVRILQASSKSGKINFFSFFLLKNVITIFYSFFIGNLIQRMLSTDQLENYKFETLKVTNPHEFVFHVEFNRPEKRNAMNFAFFR